MKHLLIVGILAATAPAWSAPDPLAALSDEFDAPSLGDYQRVRDVESWPNDQLEVLDVGVTRAGWLTLIPHTNAWYEDYRGPLVFKEVTGDFVATTSVEVSNRAGTGAPGRQYSLAGLMIRAPRAITPGTWTPNGEQYSFLSIGAASVPGSFQYEVKTTRYIDEFTPYSLLEISNLPCGCGESLLQTVRIGEYIIQLAKDPSSPWTVINRYHRPDLPATVQLGFVAYTDWENVQLYSVADHNVTTITEVAGQPGVPTEPDLLAQFDYLRFVTPEVPGALDGMDLTDEGLVSDEALLEFLGENALAATTRVAPDLWRVH